LFADIFQNTPTIRFAPDGGDGGGAGGSGGATAVEEGEEETGGEEDKTFSQKELDRIIQDRVKSFKRDLKQKDQEQKALEKKLNDLEEKFKSIGTATGGGDEGSLDLKTLQGKMEVQKQKFERELELLKVKADEAEKGRIAAEEKQRLVERDTEIQQALVAAGCLPAAMVAGMRYFIPSVEWDADEGDHGLWLFKTANGHTLTIAEGIAAELPSYMKSSTLVGGGSGTSSSKDKKRVELQNNLKDAETKLADLQKAMRASRNEPRLMADVMQQEKLVKRLRAEISAK
jgi:hypothetical protein